MERQRVGDRHKSAARCGDSRGRTAEKRVAGEATAIIAPLADAKAGGYIEDEDAPWLTEWQRYRYRLTKVDTSTAPEIIWPEPPAA